jgi:hypothetical protein
MLIPNLVGGSGISTKTLLALENSIPFVTTTLGVTGVNAEHTPTAFHIEDEPAAFAKRASALYLDAQLWKATVGSMHNHVLSCLSKTRLFAALQDTLQVALNDRCVSPRWTNASLESREHHRLVRFQRQQEIQSKHKSSGLLGNGGRA